MERFVVIVSGLIFAVISAPTPTTDNTKEELSFAKEFMSRFGYLGSGDGDSESLIRVELAIKDVQRFGGINETGELDKATIKLMKSPRCGLPDVLSTKKRSRRYVLAPTMGWKKRQLSYFISNWSPKLGQEVTRRELQRALGAWAKYGRLKFKETTSPEADIIVAFGRDYHGDPYPFDGPGLTLAHAFFPGEFESFGGDIHFDEDETWKVNPGQFDDGIDFFTVAVHEIGHSLGLSHSPAPESVMNPYYKRYDSNNFNLGYDDILAMYELYITNGAGGNESWDEDDESTRKSSTSTTTTTTRKPWTTRPTVTSRITTTTQRPKYTTNLPHYTFEGDDESVETHKTHDRTHGVPGPVEPLHPALPKQPITTPSSSEIPNACEGHFSAVSNIRGELFIFKKKYMWRMSSPGRGAPGYPVPFRRMFSDLPESLETIDAAYERNTDNNIIFFSGDRYWVHDGNRVVDGSPRHISDYGLPNYVKNIDAIMVWARNSKTYIFSGNEFWRFNESSHTMDPGYPKTIELFRGIPDNLDSAMTWTDGISYFFKDNLYWAFNNTWLKTEPFYPQEAAMYWVGCR